VGKVVGETVRLPLSLSVTVYDTFGLMELDALTEPEIVDVFDPVVDAETVGVSFREAVAPIENVSVGVPDSVFDARGELVKVTVVVEVLEELVEPVMLDELVPDFVAREEAE